MFEVDILTPAQFGAFVAWLVINRGPLSALVHPNTGDHVVSALFLQTFDSLKEDMIDEDTALQRDHTQRATWLGDRLPLDLSRYPS